MIDDEYDFSSAIRNPYARHLRQVLAGPLDATSRAYFQRLADERNMPVKQLISLYLQRSAAEQRPLDLP